MCAVGSKTDGHTGHRRARTSVQPVANCPTLRHPRAGSTHSHQRAARRGARPAGLDNVADEDRAPCATSSSTPTQCLPLGFAVLGKSRHPRPRQELDARSSWGRQEMHARVRAHCLAAWAWLEQASPWTMPVLVAPGSPPARRISLACASGVAVGGRGWRHHWAPNGRRVGDWQSTGDRGRCGSGIGVVAGRPRRATNRAPTHSSLIAGGRPVGLALGLSPPT